MSDAMIGLRDRTTEAHPTRNFTMPRFSTYRVERNILKLVNGSRRKAGLRDMRGSNHLARTARRHSRAMADVHRVYHANDAGFENVAGFSTPVSSEWAAAKEFHRLWMTSPGHRENILHDHNNQIGIGVVRKGNYFYGTQKFDYSPFGSFSTKGLVLGVIVITALIFLVLAAVGT